jgi:hypothetical protein
MRVGQVRSLGDGVQVLAFDQGVDKLLEFILGGVQGVVSLSLEPTVPARFIARLDRGAGLALMRVTLTAFADERLGQTVRAQPVVGVLGGQGGREPPSSSAWAG